MRALYALLEDMFGKQCKWGEGGGGGVRAMRACVGGKGGWLALPALG